MQDQNESEKSNGPESGAGQVAGGPSDGATGAPAHGAPAGQATADLQDALKKAELAAQEHKDAWLRAKAEIENIRKRAQLDIASAHKYATENFSAALLPVRDSLEASLATTNVTLDSLKSGVELTLKQLSAAFEKFNVTEINPLGEKFDPHRHQAMSAVASDAAPNTVVQVMQKGYQLHERVLRPALVAVAKAKDA